MNVRGECGAAATVSLGTEHSRHGLAIHAAGSHHHILGYLKIDLPAIVCVCALVPRHRPGGCLLPLIHALIPPSHGAAV